MAAATLTGEGFLRCSVTQPAKATAPPPDTGDLPVEFAVDEWLDQSQVQRRRWLVWMPPLALGAVATALLLATVGPGSSGRFPTISLVLLGVAAVAITLVSKAMRDVRSERKEVRQAEDLVLLRKWPEAIESLDRLLTRPMSLVQLRWAALVSLMRVLSRYGQFDDAVLVADEILEHPGVDPATGFAIRCSRAMMLLQADRLADASDAISKLRREVKQIDTSIRQISDAADDSAEEPSTIFDLQQEMLNQPTADEVDSAGNGDGFDSAAVLLIEMYRDIQTYHTDEALDIFREHRSRFAKQLGLRLGDALALASVAAHRSEQFEDARQWWGDATLLVSASELRRRYPETREVDGRYPAARWPGDTGGPA